MYCSKCGTMNSDNAEFCTKCGNNLKISTVAINVSSRGEMGTEKDVVLHRIFAVIIDYFVMGFLSFSIVGASIVPGLAARSPMTAISGFFMSLLVIMLLWIFYGILLETWRGQTVGKMILGIIVVKENGEPCDFLAALLRNVLRIIDSLPSFYILGFIVMAITEKRQRLGDRLAGTVVVKMKH
ncbi:RDD family protein [uncultured archaeon]|nr:RDD family protein [uncultured archaeon]